MTSFVQAELFLCCFRCDMSHVQSSISHKVSASNTSQSNGHPWLGLQNPTPKSLGWGIVFVATQAKNDYYFGLCFFSKLVLEVNLDEYELL